MNEHHNCKDVYVSLCSDGVVDQSKLNGQLLRLIYSYSTQSSDMLSLSAACLMIGIKLVIVEYLNSYHHRDIYTLN